MQFAAGRAHGFGVAVMECRGQRRRCTHFEACRARCDPWFGVEGVLLFPRVRKKVCRRWFRLSLRALSGPGQGASKPASQGAKAGQGSILVLAGQQSCNGLCRLCTSAQAKHLFHAMGSQAWEVASTNVSYTGRAPEERQQTLCEAVRTVN